eukprot:2805549-Rhodomonas_salina.1
MRTERERGRQRGRGELTERESAACLSGTGHCTACAAQDTRCGQRAWCRLNAHGADSTRMIRMVQTQHEASTAHLSLIHI